jgi:hypothetical protein
MRPQTHNYVPHTWDFPGCPFDEIYLLKIKRGKLTFESDPSLVYLDDQVFEIDPRISI